MKKAHSVLLNEIGGIIVILGFVGSIVAGGFWLGSFFNEDQTKKKTIIVNSRSIGSLIENSREVASSLKTLNGTVNRMEGNLKSIKKDVKKLQEQNALVENIFRK